MLHKGYKVPYQLHCSPPLRLLELLEELDGVLLATEELVELETELLEFPPPLNTEAISAVARIPLVPLINRSPQADKLFAFQLLVISSEAT